MKVNRNIKKIIGLVLLFQIAIITMPIGNYLNADTVIKKGMTVKTEQDVKNGIYNNNITINIPSYNYGKNNINVDNNSNNKDNDTKNTEIIGNGSNINNLLDINSEIKYFASWLKVGKKDKQYPQENNYVAKDEIANYDIEYYNGKSEKISTIKFILSIPKKVEVIEITNNGKLISNEKNSSIIEWNMDNIDINAKNKITVKVKFMADESLEESQKMSEVFYSKLETIESDNNSCSYIRQLFIDKNNNKFETVTKYANLLDITNSIRPEDEITRAEFAKIISDCGIVNEIDNSNKYQDYIDSDKIPTYSKESIAFLTEIGVMEKYSDGTIKPNNPILRDELWKMLCKITEYISEGKIKTNPAVFIDKDVINANTLTSKDYIMELIRQNIISKEQAKLNLNQYVKRSEVINIINSLAFRGPFINNNKVSKLKFVEIMDNEYFYDFIGASYTYKYNYTDNLWQNIVEVK